MMFHSYICFTFWYTLMTDLTFLIHRNCDLCCMMWRRDWHNCKRRNYSIPTTSNSSKMIPPMKIRSKVLPRISRYLSRLILPSGRSIIESILRRRYSLLKVATKTFARRFSIEAGLRIQINIHRALTLNGHAR
jgi:hypothetical protein